MTSAHRTKFVIGEVEKRSNRIHSHAFYKTDDISSDAPRGLTNANHANKTRPAKHQMISHVCTQLSSCHTHCASTHEQCLLPGSHPHFCVRDPNQPANVSTGDCPSSVTPPPHRKAT